MEKIITPQEIARLEQKAFDAGHSSEEFVHQAGASFAHLIQEFRLKNDPEASLILLLGKGNNGADALSVGIHFLKKREKVYAVQLFPDEVCNRLFLKLKQIYLSLGGFLLAQQGTFEKGLFIDGIFGTGFQGTLTSSLKAFIQKINLSSLPCLSLDIPSGLNGLTGEADLAIRATETYYLNYPKCGFFKKEGWNYVGTLRKAVFKLPSDLDHQITPVAYTFDYQEAKQALPFISPTQNKYTRGYVIGIAGSPAMPGAAHLATRASFRAGAGIVRLFSLYLDNQNESGMDELIRQDLKLDDLSPLFSELQRASSLFIGPGLGRTEEVKNLLRSIFPAITLPCVIDADALFFFKELSSLLKTHQVILTPHSGEYKRLDPSDDPLNYAKQTHCIILYKGAPTWIYYPEALPYVIPQGNPGMATAGSGDVLTGIMAAFLALKIPCALSAPLAAWVHARAGELAALSVGARSMIASDLIDHLPQVFLELEAET